MRKKTKTIMWHLYIFRSVRMHNVIIIESEMKSGFSPEMPPLICFSVSQSYLCQEVNAVRALKTAFALFLMGNI